MTVLCLCVLHSTRLVYARCSDRILDVRPLCPYFTVHVLHEYNTQARTRTRPVYGALQCTCCCSLLAAPPPPSMRAASAFFLRLGIHTHNTTSAPPTRAHEPLSRLLRMSIVRMCATADVASLPVPVPVPVRVAHLREWCVESTVALEMSLSCSRASHAILRAGGAPEAALESSHVVGVGQRSCHLLRAVACHSAPLLAQEA